ncbi:hypothetical protein NUBL21980_49480 [Klebsiella michiganensis]|nr:hypothetical protein NUBL21980_49480 [Klebsiella michiganensis]
MRHERLQQTDMSDLWSRCAIFMAWQQPFPEVWLTSLPCKASFRERYISERQHEISARVSYQAVERVKQITNF